MLSDDAKLELVPTLLKLQVSARVFFAADVKRRGGCVAR